jgi:hypothetical protein
MRHVRNPEGFVAFDGTVDDIDRVAAQYQVDQWSAGALPVLNLVLPHRIDKIVLLARTELREAAAVIERLARSIDCGDRSAIKIRIGWANIEDARFEQRFSRRD